LNHLYSLYDALISIEVPGERARAVVDAMEREMASTLATKQDLDSQTTLLRHDMEADFALLRRDMEAGFALLRHETDSGSTRLRQDMDSGTTRLRQDMDSGSARLRQDMESGFTLMRQEMAAQRESFGKDLKLQARQQIIATGVTVYSGLGLLLAALKLLP